MKPRRRIGLLVKGLIVIAVPLLYQLIYITFLFRWQREMNEAQRWVIHTKDVLAEVDALYRLLLGVQSDVRAYILTGNPIFDIDAAKVSAEVREQIRKMRAMVQDNPRQGERLSVISQRGQVLLDRYAFLDGLVDAGERDRAVNEASTLKGKVLLDALRVEMEAFRSEE